MSVTVPFGQRLPSMQVPPPGPRSIDLARRLRQVESRNVTFLAPDFPVFWEEARGANVRDADGNVYLDLTGAFGVAAAGHGHPGVVRAVARQAERLIHGMGDVHPPAVKVELLERLMALAPWPEGRGVLASTGSEAVEIALKTALLATGRPGVLAFEGGYHGLTLGALAATARPEFRRPFASRLFGGVARAPFPDPFRDGPSAGRRSLEAVRTLLGRAAASEHPVGAVIVEPIQGRGGVRVPPPGFLAELARVTREAGAVLIFDEVFTGFGRTGALFAFEHEGVVPDLICAGKALGGGLPLSVCLGSREVMDAWPESRGEALHTSTFLGHPLACAAALAFLDAVEEEELVGRAARLGTDLLGRLRGAFTGVAGVREVRGRGLFVGIETDGPAGGGGVAAAGAALSHGLIVLPAGDLGEVVELSPPLVITESQLDRGVEILVDLLVRAGGSDRNEGLVAIHPRE